MIIFQSDLGLLIVTLPDIVCSPLARLRDVEPAMSDPLSLMGSAVGIVSLGIQVCQGLVSYTRSVKGRNKDIENGLKEVQSLTSLFNSINSIIPNIDQALIDTAEIRECLEAVEAKLQEFKQLLIKLRGLPQQGHIRSKAKEVVRSLVFPIHEGGLSSLRQSVQYLLDNLNLAVTTTSLYDQRSIGGSFVLSTDAPISP